MIPDYQSFMLPVLEALRDQQTHSNSEIKEYVAQKFELTPEDRRELLPSQTMSIFDNRVAWAKTYLLKAGLAMSPKRAYVCITERGMGVLADKPERIDNKFLRQFPEFVEFSQYNKKKTAVSENGSPATNDITEQEEFKTPKEQLIT